MARGYILLRILLVTIATHSALSRSKSDVSWYDKPKTAPLQSPTLEEITLESKQPDDPETPPAAKKDTTKIKTVTDIIDETNKPMKDTVVADEVKEKLKYKPLGCYKDEQVGGVRPLPELLVNLRSQIDWTNLNKTIEKCAEEAKKKGYNVFGLHYYGECYSGKDGEATYMKQGKSTKCAKGVGKGSASFVYMFDLPVIPMKRPTVYCFPESSEVELLGNHRVPMKNIKLGDRVKTLDAQGNHAYSDVIAFLHKNDQEMVEYYSMELENGRKLHTSAKHLVFKSSNTSSAVTTVFASEIEVGDYLLANGENGNMELSRVLRVSMETEKGVYAPLTRHGTMLVDGVLVSCYAHWESHFIAHLSMAPLRVWYDVTAAFKSVGSWFGYSNIRTNQVVNGISPVNGIHWYAESLMNLAQTFSRLS